jgi:hypothetical protein
MTPPTLRALLTPPVWAAAWLVVHAVRLLDDLALALDVWED